MLSIFAPSRLRVSRFDARGDAERCRTKRLLSLACLTLSNETDLCENCNNPVCASCRGAYGDWASNPVRRTSRGAKALGYRMQSPPARAIPDYLFKDYKPSAIQGEARLRVTQTPTVTLSTIGYRLSVIAYRLSPTISPQLSRAKPACAGYTGFTW